MFSPKYLLAYKHQKGSFSVPVNITEAEVTSPLPTPSSRPQKMPVF